LFQRSFSFKRYFVFSLNEILVNCLHLIDLFDEDKRTFMNRIEELELLTRDKTKNFLLQMIEEGREEGLIEAIKGLIRKGSSTEFMCDAINVSKDYVDQVRASMEDE